MKPGFHLWWSSIKATLKQENNSVNISDDIDNDGDTIDDLDNNNLVSHGIDVENEMSSDKVKGIDILISSNSKMIGITLCYIQESCFSGVLPTMMF